MACLYANPPRYRTFPQANQGAPVLIADDLTRRMGKPNLDSCPAITIAQLSCIRPNPRQCAEEIDRIHKAFGITRSARLPLAEAFVCEFAISGIEFIRETVTGISAALQGPQPLNLDNYPIRTTFPCEIRTCFRNINRASAFALQHLLETDTPLLTAVKTDIHLQADKIRTVSKARQKQHSRVN